jgi:hypothetical protein
MFGTHAHSRHPGVTIGVGEINVSVDKDVLVIRTPCGENERGQNRELYDEKNASAHQIRNDGERTLALIRSSNIFQMLGLCAQT